MRFSLSVKFALLSALLVLVVAGATTYVLVFRYGQAREEELVARDRELSQVLAGLRRADGRLSFEPIVSFVESSDRVDTGLVYAVELDKAGALQQGSLNPRVFSALDPTYAELVQQGRKQVLEALAAGKVDRRQRIKEYALPVPGGQVRLGFNLRRIDQQISAQTQVGVVILGVGLLLGALGSVVLARRLASPIRRLAGAMEAVANGDLQQTVQVRSSDELASLAQSFNQMMRALREAGHQQQSLAPYLAPAVMKRLTEVDDPLELTPEEGPVTVAFLSLVGVDQLSFELPPRPLLALLNEYLAPVIEAVSRHDGVIYRVDGGRVKAVWGVPEPAPDGELQAVRAVLAARAAVEAEARRQAASGAHALRLRAGVATGRAVAGNLGSARRVSYTVLGAVVEVASETERLARPGELLLAEATFNKVRGRVQTRPAQPLMLAALGEAVPLYRVEGLATDAGTRATEKGGGVRGG